MIYDIWYTQKVDRMPHTCKLTRAGSDGSVGSVASVAEHVRARRPTHPTPHHIITQTLPSHSLYHFSVQHYLFNIL